MKNVRFTNDEGSGAVVMLVSKWDNVVSIKQRLSNETNINAPNIKLFSDQMMEMDDNRLFDPNIESIIYRAIENDDVIVKIRRNAFSIPKYIQISGAKTIDDLKNIFYQYSDKEMKVFSGQGVELEDERTINDCGLDDNFTIKVWKREDLFIILKIFNPLDKFDSNNREIPIKFCVSDLVRDVKCKIATSLGIERQRLYLFTETSHLQDHKQLMDYQVYDGCVVSYVDLGRNESISEDMILIKKGNHVTHFRGTLETIPGRKEELFIISYPKESNNEQFNKMLKYEIITLLKLSKDYVSENIKRFVSLISIFEKGKEVYIAYEFMKQGSLRDKLRHGSLSQKDVIRYSIQILEGLLWMHQNNILHRNINCSNVLLDQFGDAKLCNFRLSKFLYNKTIDQSLEGIPGSKIETDKCWVAPEVLSCEPYGIKADIWSVGATMIEMITGERPYANLNIVTATQRIVDSRTIDYDRRKWPILNDVIDHFIHRSQWERPTAWLGIQLLGALQ